MEAGSRRNEARDSLDDGYEEVSSSLVVQGPQVVQVLLEDVLVGSLKSLVLGEVAALAEGDGLVLVGDDARRRVADGVGGLVRGLACAVLAVHADGVHGSHQIVRVELEALGDLAATLVAQVVRRRVVGAVHAKVGVDAHLVGQVAALCALVRVAH